MTIIDPRKKAGPLGRGRISTALMQRVGLMDPRLRRNANLLATNRRTARGVDYLNLGLTEIPPPQIDVQLARVESKINEIVAALKNRGLMEETP